MKDDQINISPNPKVNVPRVTMISPNQKRPSHASIENSPISLAVNQDDREAEIEAAEEKRASSFALTQGMNKSDSV